MPTSPELSSGDGIEDHVKKMDDAERLTRIEERHAHLQRHQAEQDKAMLELAEELARLRAEVAALRAQSAGGAGPGEAPGPIADERPPHY